MPKLGTNIGPTFCAPVLGKRNLARKAAHIFFLFFTHKTGFSNLAFEENDRTRVMELGEIALYGDLSLP